MAHIRQTPPGAQHPISSNFPPNKMATLPDTLDDTISILSRDLIENSLLLYDVSLWKAVNKLQVGVSWIWGWPTSPDSGLKPRIDFLTLWPTPQPLSDRTSAISPSLL